MFAKEALKHGLATKDTKDTIIRLAPPLTIKKEQINQAIDAIRKTTDAIFK